MPTARLPLVTVGGRKFAIEGTAPTRAAAIAELNGVAALTSAASAGNPTISDAFTSGELATLVIPANVDAENGLFVMHKTGVRNKVRRFQNLITAIKNPDGTVNVTDPLVTAFAAVYYDGNGVTGYSVLKGEFTRK